MLVGDEVLDGRVDLRRFLVVNAKRKLATVFRLFVDYVWLRCLRKLHHLGGFHLNFLIHELRRKTHVLELISVQRQARMLDYNALRTQMYHGSILRLDLSIFFGSKVIKPDLVGI